MPRGFAEDYIQVNERIIAFKEQFPEGSLQSEIVEHDHYGEDGTGMVVIKAYAYRTADDPRPGIGHSGLKIPGRSPFTLGSELENAETSAWGRALAALGFEVKRGIASREEIAMKSDGDVTVNIEGSAIDGVERGGRTAKANQIQVRQVRQLSRKLELGPIGMRDVIQRIFGDLLVLPEDEVEAAAALVSYLEDLSREDIGTLITALTAAVEAGSEAVGEV